MSDEATIKVGLSVSAQAHIGLEMLELARKQMEFAEAHYPTIRDRFAAAALQGQLASLSHPDAAAQLERILSKVGVENARDALAVISYQIADAMIVERKKGGAS